MTTIKHRFKDPLFPIQAIQILGWGIWGLTLFLILPVFHTYYYIIVSEKELLVNPHAEFFLLIGFTLLFLGITITLPFVFRFYNWARIVLLVFMGIVLFSIVTGTLSYGTKHRYYESQNLLEQIKLHQEVRLKKVYQHAYQDMYLPLPPELRTEVQLPTHPNLPVSHYIMMDESRLPVLYGLVLLGEVIFGKHDSQRYFLIKPSLYYILFCIIIPIIWMGLSVAALLHPRFSGFFASYPIRYSREPLSIMAKDV